MGRFGVSFTTAMPGETGHGEQHDGYRSGFGGGNFERGGREAVGCEQYVRLRRTKRLTEFSRAEQNSTVSVEGDWLVISEARRAQEDRQVDQGTRTRVIECCVCDVVLRTADTRGTQYLIEVIDTGDEIR